MDVLGPFEEERPGVGGRRGRASLWCSIRPPTVPPPARNCSRFCPSAFAEPGALAGGDRERVARLGGRLAGALPADSHRRGAHPAAVGAAACAVRPQAPGRGRRGHQPRAGLRHRSASHHPGHPAGCSRRACRAAGSQPSRGRSSRLPSAAARWSTWAPARASSPSRRRSWAGRRSSPSTTTRWPWCRPGRTSRRTACRTRSRSTRRTSAAPTRAGSPARPSSPT